MTTIKLKNGSGAPAASDLVQGEPALDLTNKRLYTENASGTVIEVGTNPTSLTTGTFTSTGIDDNATSTAITIDSSGDVGIGLASPLFQATDRTAVTINGTTSSNLVFGVGGSANTYFLADSSGFTIGNTSASLPTMFYTNGAERMRIDSSGRLLLNTTDATTGSLNPTVNFKQLSNASYHRGMIIESTDSDAFIGIGYSGSAFEIGASYRASAGYKPITVVAGGYERMRIDTSGNVGIGTSSPASKLTVNDDGIALRLDGTGNTTRSILLRNVGGSAEGVLRTDGNMHLLQEDASKYMRFSTANTERMRIDSSGNVGIGTTSPNKPLEISKTGGGAVIRLNNPDSTVSSGESLGSIEWQSNDASTPGGTGTQAIINVIDTNTFGTAYAMTFTTSDSGTTAERMRITSSGNTLMGLTSDYYSAKLAVGQSGGNPAIACRTTSTSGTVPLVLFTDGNSQDCGSIDVDASANTTNYGTSSDQRLKENIVDAPAGNIDDVRVRSFDWKSSGHHQTYGLVAQELVDVAPEAVSQGKKEEDTWKIDYSKLVPMMIKEIQDLKAEVAALKGA